MWEGDSTAVVVDVTDGWLLPESCGDVVTFTADLLPVIELVVIVSFGPLKLPQSAALRAVVEMCSVVAVGLFLGEQVTLVLVFFPGCWFLHGMSTAVLAYLRCCSND